MQVGLLDGTLNALATATVAGGKVIFPLAVGLYKLQAAGLSRYLEIGAGTPSDIP